jgi:hypothetical protein
MAYLNAAPPAATNSDRTAPLFTPGYLAVGVLVTSLFFPLGNPQ